MMLYLHERAHVHTYMRLSSIDILTLVHILSVCRYSTYYIQTTEAFSKKIYQISVFFFRSINHWLDSSKLQISPPRPPINRNNNALLVHTCMYCKNLGTSFATSYVNLLVFSRHQCHPLPIKHETFSDRLSSRVTPNHTLSISTDKETRYRR